MVSPLLADRLIDPMAIVKIEGGKDLDVDQVMELKIILFAWLKCLELIYPCHEGMKYRHPSK
jgi:hypothetical protein